MFSIVSSVVSFVFFFFFSSRRRHTRSDRDWSSDVCSSDLLQYEIIANLDADISFEKDHFEFLARKFSEDPTLGVAGTVFREDGYSSERDSFEGHKHVSGQCQLFRRQCWNEIGGYIPHHAGGIDWMAVTTARMKG